jgi:hypothetical protein
MAVEQSIPNDNRHNSWDITSLQCSRVGSWPPRTGRGPRAGFVVHSNKTIPTHPNNDTKHTGHVLVKPVVAQLVKKFSAFHGTCRCFTVFTGARRLSLKQPYLATSRSRFSPRL